MKIYREAIKSAGRDLEIPFEVHPHDLQYGGATYDYICDKPLQDARLWGRWISEKMPKNYILVKQYS